MPRTRRLSQERQRRLNAEAMASRRADSTSRATEQARNTEARRLRRQDPVYHSQEQFSDTLFHARARARGSQNQNHQLSFSSNEQGIPLWSPHAEVELHEALLSLEPEVIDQGLHHDNEVSHTN
jgi:hypothetical protein